MLFGTRFWDDKRQEGPKLQDPGMKGRSKDFSLRLLFTSCSMHKALIEIIWLRNLETIFSRLFYFQNINKVFETELVDLRITLCKM